MAHYILRFNERDVDWIMFNLPHTRLITPMVQTAFGDGTYPVYFGFDNKGKVCEIVAQFVDIELAFLEED